jgi:hypothetical protein
MNSFKSLKSLKILFESSTVALTNLATFKAAVGATVSVVAVQVEDLYKLPKYLHRFVAHAHDFQIHITKRS